MRLTSVLVCKICELVLHDPVTLPCLCVICKEHLYDGSAKNGSVKCLKCGKCFAIPESEFPANEMATNILDNEFHLSEEEKALRKTFQDMIEQLKQLQSEVDKKQADLQMISFNKFSEIRLKIDILREEMKKKIDEIALKMIDEANEKEKAYKLRINKSFRKISDKELKKSSRLFMDEYRKPDLILENLKRLMSEQELHIIQLEAKLADFNAINTEIESVEFRFGKGFQEENFGKLKLSKPLSELVSTTKYHTIKIWDLETYECISTLEGHTMEVISLEWLGNKQIASGSYDGKIKIWNIQENVCIKTLVGHHVSMCLKSLNANTLVSGLFKDIKIWDIDSGTCMQTLKGHTDWIRSLTRLHNGSLLSCSDDKTIKVWDLDSGACTKTLNTSNVIHCLLLLPNGHLASGSREDHLINIWNIESGEIITTLSGHSGFICRLQTLGTGELVSCSSNGAIKIWNLDNNACIKTLHEHIGILLMGITVLANNTLIGFYADGAIQVWNLDTSESVNKFNGHDVPFFRDLLVI